MSSTSNRAVRRTATVYLSESLLATVAAGVPARNPAADGAQDGEAGILVTGSSSRLTHPLACRMLSQGARWVIDRDDGQTVDGFTGAMDRGSGMTNAADGAAAVVGVEPAEPVAHLFAAVLHPASLYTSIGVFSETLLTALGLAAPHSFGEVEPVDQDWDVAALTTLYRDHYPTNPVVVVGPGYTGTLSVERTVEGVRELLDVVFAPSGPLDPSVVDDLATTAISLRAAQVCLEYVFNVDQKLRRMPGQSHIPVPALLVWGPQLLREVGTRAAVEASQPFGTLAGRAPAQHLVVRYPSTVPGRRATQQPHPVSQQLALLSLPRESAS